MRFNFTILEAYLFLWQRIAEGEALQLSFIEELCNLEPYKLVLERYYRLHGIDREQFIKLLGSLSTAHVNVAPPILTGFHAKNRQAIGRVGYWFDIIFPLRKFSLVRLTARLQAQNICLPMNIQLQPELATRPYMLADSLVLDFFSLSIDKRGRLQGAGLPLEDYLECVVLQACQDQQSRTLFSLDEGV